MRKRITFLATFAIISSHCFAKELRPATVSDAVNVLISQLSDEEKHLIARTAESKMWTFHRGLGQGIRNSFGLWGDNEALLQDCGDDNAHPDSCSGVIVEALWKTLRTEIPPDELRSFDALEKELDSVRVPPVTLENVPLTEVVAFLNDVIRDSGRTPEQIRLFTAKRAEIEKVSLVQKREARLWVVLETLELGYGLKIVKRPPEIILGGGQN
jgi:hypothetical protein